MAFWLKKIFGGLPNGSREKIPPPAQTWNVVSLPAALEVHILISDTICNKVLMRFCIRPYKVNSMFCILKFWKTYPPARK